MADERPHILLALDVCSVLSATLAEGIATMAARLEVELEGLFVEDQGLLRAAALPFVQEVSATGRERSFTPQDLHHQNLHTARELDRLLARAADERRVRWSFRSVAGDPLATAYAESMRCDLFVPGQGRGRRGSSAAGGGMFRRLCIVPGGADHTRRALSVLHALARNGHTQEVLIVSDGQPPGELLEAIARAGNRAFVQVAPESEAGALLDAFAHFEPDLVVAPRHCFPLHSSRLRQAPGSVLLLR